MNKKALTVVLLALAGGLWLARPFEPAAELPAGTVLADGTVAGERQALAYFRARDPELSAALEILEPAARREKYGRYFPWFQRVGNYRTGQKLEMTRRLRIRLGMPATAGEEQAYEWPAGTILEDGTVAGEMQALEFFRADAPDLARQLHAMDEKARRERFGAKFAWFQRVGNYRKRQKAEMIRQLRDELAVEDLSRRLRAAGAARDRALSVELRARIASLDDSRTGLMDYEALGLKGEISELAGRPVVWLFQPGEMLRLRRQLGELELKLAERRKSRDARIERGFAEIAKG